MRVRPVLRPFAVSLVALSAVLAVATPAAAQGTSGTLPGPISSAQLQSYATRLGLSAEQRRAMEAIHDEYRADFRMLRDGDIAVFLAEQRKLQGGLPRRDRVEEVMETFERIQAMIRAVDDGFFARLGAIVTAEQQAGLPRVRLLRERERLAVQQTAVRFGRKTPDLSELLYGQALPPEVFAQADAISARYEQRLTRLMRKQGEAIGDMMMNMVAGLEERGFSDLTPEELMADPEKVQRMLEALRETYAQLGAEVNGISREIRELNGKTHGRIAGLLGPGDARRFRNAYYRAAYPELATLVGLSERDWMTRALALPDLDEDPRATLAGASRLFQRELDRMLDRGVELVQSFWDDFSPFELDPSRGERMREGLETLRQQAESMRDEASGQMDQVLGEATVREIRRQVAALDDQPQAAPPPPVMAGMPQGAVESRPELGADEAGLLVLSRDRFVPARISRRDLDRYADALDLDEGRREVLTTLHADYVERVKGLPVIDELEDARDATGPGGAAGEGEGEADIDALAKRVDRVDALRREAIAAVEREDDELFESIAAVAGSGAGAGATGELERLRRARRRQCLAATASEQLAFGRDSSREASVDVAAIVSEHDWEAGRPAGLEGILDEYDEQSIPALRARLETQLSRQRMGDLWRAEMREATRRDVGEIMRLQSSYRERIRPINERVREADAGVVEVNRRTLERIGALSPAAAPGLRHRYERAAFPSVFADPTAVDRQLGAALGLPGLNAAQRERLADLAASYRTEYEGICQRMIEAMGPGAVPLIGLDNEGYKVWQEHQQNLARLRFDRRELNARAIGRLGEMLDQEQIRRIGGLPDPEAEEEGMYFLR